MSREKQIEEMSTEIREAVNGCSSYWSGLIAEHLYEQGYRKQSEGEWRAKDNINGRCSIAVCSNCGTTKGLAVLLPIETVTRDFPYCEKCGAKMKGGEGE